MEDYYIDTALKHLREVYRILNMTAPEYYQEVISKEPQYKELFKVNDMWAFRTGVIQTETELALQALEQLKEREKE